VNVVVAAPNVAPAVSVVTDRSRYTAPASVAISAVATDSDGAVARVEFYAGTTRLSADTTSPYSFVWSGAANGTYGIRAVAVDNAGASTWSSTVNITIGRANAAPTVSLAMPVTAAAFTAPATIALSASASDTDGTVARVDFYSGATLLGSDTTSPYAYTWTNVPAGTYAVRAVATDNLGATTSSATVSLTVDANAAPTVSLTSPATGASFTAPATVTLTASATDPGGSIQKVDFYRGTTLLGTDTTSPYSFNWTNVPTGSYSLSAVATDNLGATTVSSWADVTVTSTAVLSRAEFSPAVVADSVSYYVLEIFAAGADPDTSAPVATQHLGLPPVVDGVCTSDVGATILGLSPGSYVATVSSVSPADGKLRSIPTSFTR
jgi:uncharacterized protein (DUF2141 family)